jgi:hypothetical protein
LVVNSGGDQSQDSVWPYVLNIMLWLAIFVSFGLYIWFALSYPFFAAVIGLNVLSEIHEEGKRLSKSSEDPPS